MLLHIPFYYNYNFMGYFCAIVPITGSLCSGQYGAGRQSMRTKAVVAVEEKSDERGYYG